MTERVPIGSDHAGYDLKERLKAELEELGFEPVDVGTHSAESVDYSDYAKRVASEVANGSVARGVLMCGTGLGMSYTANRFPGVRAALAWTPEIAELSRRHNDANVLVLPARFIEPAQGIEILRRWLEAPFDGGRHERRVAKIEGDT
ncbi:MAG: ribose 5-phosphate isomerase B [Gemmatimonadetes bacterium]|nr:ribose 5-phosphate isomerase B [Gemmatimonadota bacterium]MCH7716481.1 ribose 5-phosphate isomerase B [Gemmatimonadota bacterium]